MRPRRGCAVAAVIVICVTAACTQPGAIVAPGPAPSVETTASADPTDVSDPPEPDVASAGDESSARAARCDRRNRGPGCPRGTYWIHGRPIARMTKGASNDALIIRGNRISTRSGCRPTPMKIRPTRTGYRISATWRRCGRGAVTISGAVDGGTRGTFVGRLTAKLVGTVALVATRTTGDAIRIGTYNAKFLTSGPPASYQKNPADAAEKIAERVIASGYDFIALQEIWDEDAKSDDDPHDGFVQALKGTYPHYVQYVDGDQANPHEDSGLMFFSRFPFRDLPDDTYEIDDGDCEATDCDKVAFAEFDSCDDDDCLAEKGAGLVRLRNPQTDHTYNVAFTHMQAPYYDDSADDMLATYETRKEQLTEIRKLLQETLDANHFASEEIYLLGDLNIDGDLANPNNGAPDPDNPTTAMFVHNRHEWARAFANPGAFYTETLADSWARDTSPDDRGLSAPRNYEPHFEPPAGRLDFIARKRNSRLCTQHLTLSHNLRWGAPYVESGLGQPGTEAGAIELSDHIGVTADINLPAPYCSARRPRSMTVGAGQVREAEGEIRHPQGMQWYRFAEAGTYGFAVDRDDVDFHVYESTDLSMPMANYKDLTRTVLDRKGNSHEVQMFEAPNAPFYVRVFVPDQQSTWTGSYKLIAKRYNCSAREEACLLQPRQRRKASFPGGTIVGEDDAMWFEVHTEAAGWDRPGQARVETGKEQKLEFEVDRLDPGSSDLLSMQVLAEDGTTVVAGDDTPEPDPGDQNATHRLVDSVREAGPATRFIRVKRSDPAVQVSYRVQWRTNLTVLHGSQVGVPNAVALDFSIADHGDSIGDEEYYFWLIADGQTVVDEKHLGDYSEPSNQSLEHLISAVRYVDSVQAIFVEVDNAYNGGYETLDDDDLIQATIDTLDPDEGCAVAETRTMSDDEEGGTYVLSFNRCHGLPTA